MLVAAAHQDLTRVVAGVTWLQAVDDDLERNALTVRRRLHLSEK